ncbi:nuclear transport factor 2 family protein [Pseudoalteromonas sp. MMG022]|uniref:nuclear transport factor 2 family protein n=1 Tax=Pseudoalteromonas sp. MMG022 TaxID=2909978 RepID=UPI001F1865FF|nr:nuclear transport factor 2 family protein [Pseudoalteromonas sp. MMG022]MCF6437090.1 nuclear transport factor 2 family protein [Pseudoalteromonas sp. MMG022]
MKQLTLSIIALFILTACKTTHTVNDSHIKLCEKTIHDYIQYRDLGPIEQYQALFTADATFSVPKLNIALNTSEAIANRAKKALMTKKSIHMITSTNIKQLSQNTYSNVSHFVLHLSDKNTPNAKRKIFNGRYVDTLIIQNDQCLIKTRNVLIDRMDTLP